MAAKIGYKSYVGLGEESSFGTAVAPTSFVEFTSESFKKDITEKLVEAINGGRQFTKRVTLDQSVDGSLNFPMCPGVVLKLFKHLSGDAGTVAMLTAGVYQWSFVFNTVATNTSLTMQVCRDTADTLTTFNYTGCKVASAAFNNSVGDMLNASVSFLGKDQVSANTISTASYRTYAPYTFVNGTIKIGDTLAAATTTTINSFSLKVENGLLDDRSIGSATRDVIEPGMQNITYDIESRYENNNLLNRFLNGTKTYISAAYDTGITISSTYTHKITFESFNCYFNGTVPNVGGANQILKHSIPIRAIREDASVGALKVTIITDLATV